MPDGAAVHALFTRVRLLGAGRAAALVALAAGINGTVAAFAPRYDGTYLSVGAVAVIACLEGVPAGLLAAVAALVIDRILGGAGFTTATIAAMAAANVIAFAGRFLLRHPKTRPQPMAEGEAAMHIDRLQAELARVRSEADSHRDAAAEMRRAVAGEIEEKQKSWREERQLLERSRGEALTAVDQLRTELQKAQRDAERVRAASKQREQELTASAVAEREQLQLALESEKNARASDALSAASALETTGGQVEELEQELAGAQAELAALRDHHAASLSDLDVVRAQLALKVSEHEELRFSHSAHQERATEFSVRASERVADLEQRLQAHAAVASDLDAARQHLALMSAEGEELRSTNVAMDRRLAMITQQSSARIGELEEQLEQLGPELDRARSTAADARSAVADLERQRAEDAERLREREGRVLEQYEEESATLQRQAEEASEALRKVMLERDEMLANVAAIHAQTLGAAAHENESLRQMATERSADASRNADLRRDAEERLASSQRDVRALHDRVEELQRKFEAELRKSAEATAAVVTRETDVRRDLESRLAAAEQRAGEFRRQVEEMESDLNAERIRSVEEKNAVDGEWNEKLQRIVTNLASDHESDLGEAMTHREQARAEVRQATKRLEQAQRINAELAARHGALEHDVAALRIALDEERSRGAIERGELEEKLHALVGNVASDHENDIGELMEQREIARAQARTFEARLTETQRAFDDATEALATMSHDLRQARTAVEDERKLRQRLDIEWNEKLQKIVTHLASDHEADVGQATVEREGAKAEARSLTMRLASMQQTIDSEREAFRAAQQKWTSIRDSLLDKMQKTEDRYRQVIEKQRREHQTEREAIEAELRVLKTSERPFTPEEIAAIRSEEFGPSEPFPAVEAFSAPEPMPAPVEPANATEPMPAYVEERKPLILVVHHNPALRSMTKEALNANGYEVLTAADGAEGLRMTRSHKPDVVIADVSMPKMDGRELCQAIKGNDETASIKIVLMSGMYTNEIPTGAAATDIPPDDILRKPVKAEALKASVAGLLAKTVATS